LRVRLVKRAGSKLSDAAPKVIPEMARQLCPREWPRRRTTGAAEKGQFLPPAPQKIVSLFAVTEELLYRNAGQADCLSALVGAEHRLHPH
jgi:hypothetical protein